MKNKAIPVEQFPSGEVEFDRAPEEALIELSDIDEDAIIADMRYYKQKIRFATGKCYLRESVWEKLKYAVRLLPSGYKFKIYDGWRPFKVQRALYDDYRKSLEDSYRGRPLPDDFEQLVAQFVSVPNRDPEKPPVHCTGGAVDLTIVDTNGIELDMGGKFDDFREISNTAYFEKGGNTEARDNRRLLYNIMLASGFSNLPSEWWHFDYGDRFWAIYYNQKAKYRGVWDIDRPSEGI